MFAGHGKWAFLLFPESFEHLLLSPTQAKSSAKIKRHHELKITVFPIFLTIFIYAGIKCQSGADPFSVFILGKVFLGMMQPLMVFIL